VGLLWAGGGVGRGVEEVEEEGQHGGVLEG
jgi:hypothetical protein